MRFICFFGILISMAAIAKETVKSKTAEAYRINTAEAFPVTLGKCDEQGDFSKQREIAKYLRDSQKSFYLVFQGDQISARSLDSDASGNANDTIQVRCYRCGMGQKIGMIDEKFCKEQYGIWDVSKGEVKARCK